MDLEAVKAVYRAAIDAAARDDEGPRWWDAVSQEISAVVAAPDVVTAAAVIAWWHADWTAVHDTPARAARRLRRAAARLASNGVGAGQARVRRAAQPLPRRATDSQASPQDVRARSTPGGS